MDFLIDNIEEDAERTRLRKERAARMRMEKQRQMRLRRRMKMMLKVSVGIFAVVLVLAVGVIIFNGKTEEDVLVSKEQDEFVSRQKETDAVQETQQQTMEQQEPETEPPVTPAEPLTLAVANGEIYSFESTPNTVAIYNEEIISSNIILVNEETNKIVASKGAKERISPASMTKVLTLLVAAENITEEQLDDTFVMTREITDYGYVNDCSAVGFLDGEKITIRDLFYGTILPSGGDAAVGLATYVAGSHEAFVEMMNEKLEELGLGNTSHYTNCVGIYDKEHYSTVYDMAVIMKAAIQNEFCKKILAEHNYTTEATTEHPEGINISNWFLRRIEDYDTGGEVLCAKTGYVDESRSCAVSYGTFADGNPYICVTTGSSSSWKCIYDHIEIYNEYVSS